MNLIEKAFEKKQLRDKAPTTPSSQMQTQEQFGSDTVSSSEDVTIQHARLEIDANHLSSHGMITLDEKRSPIKEEFRFIKRKILRNAFGPQSKTLHHPNLIIVTSCHPFEGKTFVSSNLAISVAHEKDNTVLFADADVLRPNVCHTLGLDEPECGLISHLLGETDSIGEAIFSTNIDRLSLLPSGPRHHLSVELLQSQRMIDLATELAHRYSDRLIILDAPPLLGVNETQILASLVGQVIVVVEEDRTTQKDLKSALALLDPEKAVGCILNKSSNKHHGYGYGYGYASR